MRSVELDVQRLDISARGVEPFFWPVSRAELALARSNILLSFCSVVRREVIAGRSGGVLSAAPFYFAAEAISLLEACLLVERWKAAGVVPSVPERWRVIGSVANGQMPAVTASPLVVQLRNGPTRSPRWRRAFSPARNLIRRGPVPRRRLRSVDAVSDTVVTTTGSLLDAHRHASDESVVFVDYGEWFTPVPAGSTASDPSAAHAIEQIVEGVEPAFITAGARFTKDVAGHLTDWLRAVLSPSLLYAEQIAATPARVPRKLWVGTAGSVWARFLFHEVDARGGQVTAHDHGTGSGFRVNPEKTVTDLSGCHEFVTFTAQQAEDTRSQVTSDLLLIKNPPTVSWVRDPIAGRKIPTARRSPLSRLMVLTNFFRGDAHHHASVLADPVAVDFHARFFAQLVDWGYEVLHKPHPESRVPPPTGLHRLGVDQVDGYFEDVLDRADAIVLLWDAPSTSLRVALATDLPIVLVDLQQGAWRPHALNMLAQRCAVVRAGFDQDNRVAMDWEALKRAIDESSELRDETFFDAYFRG